MNKSVDLTDPFLRGLAGAALNPGLRSILVFDASSSTLQFTAQILAHFLKVVSDSQVSIVQLGAIETEEDLWGSLTLTQGSSERPFEWRSGILSEGRISELRVVVIPDLTRLSLAAARACVMLMGSDVGHLERHGHQERWQPNLCWLAGCSRDAVGLVSPHLLDRFALYFSELETRTIDRATQIKEWLQQTEVTQIQDDSFSSPEICQFLQQVRSYCPEITPEASSRILDYIPLTKGYSVRRELALLRLARTNAQLEQADQVTRQDIDRAAQIIGLELVNQPQEPVPSAPKKPDEPEQTPSDPSESSSVDPSSSEPSKETPQLEPVYGGDKLKLLPSIPLVVGRANPYPEDTTAIERESASLRLPPRRFKSAESGRGVIIGVEPTTIPQNLALVSTLLEAAKYRGFRLPKKHSLTLQSSDLRRYRRAAVAEQMLTVVLDHTCLQDCLWQDSLLPYLQWAYVERANICLIQVGSAQARQELQAEKIIAQNILVPRIRNDLEAGRGNATPLAHGLDLALQTLRHALQHGRSTVQQAVLVVISDGRGNVPLAASRLNRKPTLPVKQQGIKDALQVGLQIATLNGVKTVVLNPQPKHYADLPVKLALALKAKIADIPPLETWEVEE